MKEIENMALEICKGREERLNKHKKYEEEAKKEDEKKYEARIKKMVQTILEVFKASDEDNTTETVWKILLTCRNTTLIRCLVAFSKDKDSKLYPSYYDELGEYERNYKVCFKNLIPAIERVNCLAILQKDLKHIYDIFKNIPGFNAVFENENNLIIIMNEPTQFKKKNAK